MVRFARPIFAGRSHGPRLTIRMAVRPWYEPSSRLRFSAPKKSAISFAGSLAMGPAKAQSGRSARPTQSFHLDWTLAFAAVMEIARPCSFMPSCATQRRRHSTGVGGGNGTRTAARGERKPVLPAASAIGIRTAMVRVRKPSRPTKPSRGGPLWRESGRVPPSPRCQYQARRWQLQPRTPSRQHLRQV